MNKIVAAAMLSLLVAGSARAGGRPDWVEGKSREYPASSYLTGVGLGRDVDQARSNARAEIAKVFNARVVQTAQDTSRESVTVANGRRDTSGGTSAEISTRVQTDAVLQGVRIADTWYDSKKKTHYALAVFDRRAAKRDLAFRAAEQEEAIRAAMAAADAAVHPEDRVRALSRALEACDLRDAISARRRVIDPSAGADVGAGPSRTGIERRRQEALSRILFYVYPGDFDDVLGGRIRERITSMGFTVLPALPGQVSPGTSVVTVKYSLFSDPVERGNPRWKFYGWSTALEMATVGDEGKIVAADADRGEASHLTYETARSKAVSQAADALARSVERQIGLHILGKDPAPRNP